MKKKQKVVDLDDLIRLQKKEQTMELIDWLDSFEELVSDLEAYFPKDCCDLKEFEQWSLAKDRVNKCKKDIIKWFKGI